MLLKKSQDSKICANHDCMLLQSNLVRLDSQVSREGY